MYKQAVNPLNLANITIDSSGQLVLSSDVALGPPAVLEYVGTLAPEVFRMYQDPTLVTCEHPAMADTAWAMPVVFTRSADKNQVQSFAIVNWEGQWIKQ